MSEKGTDANDFAQKYGTAALADHLREPDYHCTRCGEDTG